MRAVEQELVQLVPRAPELGELRRHRLAVPSYAVASTARIFLLFPETCLEDWDYHSSYHTIKNKMNTNEKFEALPKREESSRVGLKLFQQLFKN